MNQTVASCVEVSTRGKPIVEVYTDIIDYSFIMVLHPRELHIQGGKKKRRIRVANTYDNNQ